MEQTIITFGSIFLLIFFTVLAVAGMLSAWILFMDKYDSWAERIIDGLMLFLALLSGFSLIALMVMIIIHNFKT